MRRTILNRTICHPVIRLLSSGSCHVSQNEATVTWNTKPDVPFYGICDTGSK